MPKFYIQVQEIQTLETTKYFCLEAKSNGDALQRYHHARFVIQGEVGIFLADTMCPVNIRESEHNETILTKEPKGGATDLDEAFPEEMKRVAKALDEFYD